MLVETIRVGDFQTNCYLAYDEESKEGFVVDPGGDGEKILAAAERLEVTIRCIILTHSHFDHIMALSAVHEKCGAPVAIHVSEADELAKQKNTAAAALGLGDLSITPCKADLLLSDGDVLEYAGQSLTVIHTPGHTVGSICIDTGSVLFSGDTLFEDSCGRWDLPGGDVRILLKSLRRLSLLEGDRIVYPGHGFSTTLTRERQVNSAMLHAQRSTL